MKSIKMLGLAVIAALAAMALIGAGSASATVLCAEEPSGGACPEESAYPEGTTLEASAQNVEFAGAGWGGSDLVCETSEMMLITTSQGGAGEAVTGEVQVLDFSDCETTAGLSCTPSTYNHPYAASFENLSGNNGRLTIANGGNGEPGFAMTCAGQYCAYGFGTSTLPVIGGDPASTVANARPLKRLAGPCGSEASWSANYQFTAPTAVFVANS